MRASYMFVDHETTDTTFVIRDINGRVSVTNDAEAVVESLAGILKGRRLLYYDSDGNRDELLVSNGSFAGFAFPHV